MRQKKDRRMGTSGEDAAGREDTHDTRESSEATGWEDGGTDCERSNKPPLLEAGKVRRANVRPLILFSHPLKNSGSQDSDPAMMRGLHIDELEDFAVVGKPVVPEMGSQCRDGKDL